MIKRNGLLAAALAGTLCMTGWAMSDDKKAPENMPGMDPAMMEAWQKSMTPNEHHAALKAMEGDFKYVNKMKMDPNQPEMTSEGKTHSELMYGGRFLASDVTGEMMGEKFEGKGVMGYDNSIGKYVFTWMDNMGTGLMRSEGTPSNDNKTITFEGEMMDPMMGKMCKYKVVYNIKSNDEYEMRWWSPNPANGEMFESMQIMYTRVK